MVFAFHIAGRGRERAARDVVERGARLDDRLLADHALATHLVAAAASVGDDPFAADQLHGGRAAILDAHVIGPEPAPARRLRLLGKEADRDADGDPVGRLAVGKEALHGGLTRPIPFPRQPLRGLHAVGRSAKEPTMARDWTPSSWRQAEARQQPDYPDSDALAAALREIQAYPPLVPAEEAHALQDALAEAQAGRAFLLQAGDCAESFAFFSPETIRSGFAL